ncbi:MAG: glycosyltransferase family 4 protein, partial [Anaerolineae bacterium]|nr:glycosyltransferase family 4 protein [Anaerolineae bacterium]
MNICIVCSEYPPGPHGGIGTSAMMLARGMVERGHNVYVVGMYKPSYPAPDYEEDQGVKVWRLRDAGKFPGSWLWARFRLFRFVQSLIKTQEIEIVEVADYAGWAAGWPRLSVPLIVRLHSAGSLVSRVTGREIKRLSFWLERRSLARADCWVSVSRYIAEETKDLFQLSPDHVEVIPNFVVAAEEQEAVPRLANRVIFAGTLNENKGVVSLVKSWHHVRSAHNHAELHIFGKDGRTATGQSMKEYLLTEMGDPGELGIEFHGHVQRDELFQAFRTARAAVLPSFTEACSLVAIEAMNQGCPTIFTKRASGPELIADGVDGLLVDPQDSDEIAAKIIQVLSDDVLAARLGAAGREKIRREFSADVCV